MANRRDDVIVEKCVELYKQNPNMLAIAEKLDCNHMTVRDRLLRAGIDTSGKSSRSQMQIRKQKAKQGRELPDFENREERLQYMRNHQRLALMEFVAEIAEGINERRRKRG